MGTDFLLSHVCHLFLSSDQYAINFYEIWKWWKRRIEGFLWSSSHPAQISCMIRKMKFASSGYCITWLLAVIQLSPLFLVQLYGSTQWSFADVNSTFYLTALISIMLQIVRLNPMMGFIMATSDVSHYIGFMFHLLLQPHNLIAINLVLSGLHIWLLNVHLFPSFFIYILEWLLL